MFLLHFGGPWTPLKHLGVHFATLGSENNVFLIRGGTLGLFLFSHRILFGTLGVHFAVRLRLWGRTLFAALLEKV